MRWLRKAVIIVLSIASIGGVAMGISSSLHSQLFIFKKIEVIHLNRVPFLSTQLDDSVFTRSASDLIGRVSLLDLDIKKIHQRLLHYDWIQEVKLQKKFPSTLVISMALKEPKAVLQNPNGSLAYLDAEGKSFGNLDLESAVDLPILSGFYDDIRLRAALNFLNKWERSELRQLAWVSTLSWSSERGFRLLFLYPLIAKKTNARAIVDLGQEIDGNLPDKLFRLANVVRYLSNKSIAARQIWADAGKKVVVKTAPDS